MGIVAFRFIHTADWHLGHSLHGFSRDEEHRAFLEWLLHQAVEQEADALLIAGDIFDTANPPASAVTLYYSFLAKLKTLCPQLEVVVIAGNHDSPQRLHAPQALLKALNIHVVGTVPEDPSEMLINLHDKDGTPAACCAAVPFLRPSDLPAVEAGDPLIEGVRQLYTSVFNTMPEDLAGIAMGHAYLVGTSLSELSERKVLGGNQHALPADIFPGTLSYTALGHLHLPQSVGRENIRYSGSPIPLSLSEDRYHHQVVLVELQGKELRDSQPLSVPRSVDIISLPKQGYLGVPELEAALTKLPSSNAFLKLSVRLEKPEPQLRQMVEACIAETDLRLCLLQASYPQASSSREKLGDGNLQRLDPEKVFRHRYRSEYQEEPSPKLLEAFHELMDQAQQEVGA